MIAWMKEKAWVAFLLAIIINIFSAGFWVVVGINKALAIKAELKECRETHGHDKMKTAQGGLWNTDTPN